MGVDETWIADLLRLSELVAQCSYDQALDLGRRDAADRSGLTGLALEQGGRDIIPVLHAVLAGVARRHAMATVIKDAARQQGFGFHPGGIMIVHLLRQFGLDSIEQGPVDNGRLLAGQDLALEDDLSNVKPVAQEMRDRTAGERNAADGLTGF